MGSRKIGIRLVPQSVPGIWFAAACLLGLLGWLMSAVLLFHPTAFKMMDAAMQIEAHKEAEVLNTLDVAQLRIAAEAGNPRAQRLLAQDYRQGNRLEKNARQTFRWMLKAAENNDAVAQEAVAEMYAYGWGVERNVAAATEWRVRAEQNPDTVSTPEADMTASPEDVIN